MQLRLVRVRGKNIASFYGKRYRVVDFSATLQTVGSMPYTRSTPDSKPSSREPAAIPQRKEKSGTRDVQ